MKSYKEIYDEIEVSKEVKEKTLMSLHKKNVTSNTHFYRYASAIVLILILCGSVLLWNQKNNELAYEVKNKNPENVKEKESTSMSEESVKQTFHLSTYLMDDIKIDAKTIGDIAGSLKPMNTSLRKSVAFAPIPSDLILPTGYRATVDFKQYVFNDIGPYANVFYHAYKDDKYQFNFTIKDKRMPSCFVYDEKEVANMKEYNGYRVAITHTPYEGDVEFYWLYAIRGDFEIEGSAMVENQEDFTNFLESFLR